MSLLISSHSKSFKDRFLKKKIIETSKMMFPDKEKFLRKTLVSLGSLCVNSIVREELN